MTSATSSQTAGNAPIGPLPSSAVLLAVDTSSLGSLAVGRVENRKWKIENQTEWRKLAMHSDVATIELQNLLKKCSLELKDLTHLAVNVGPGSFTGLRVGVNLVRTLGYSLNLPCATANTLELLAGLNAHAGERVLVATKAVQIFYYCGVFEKKSDGQISTLVSPHSCTFEEANTTAQKNSVTKVFIEGRTPDFDPETHARALLEHIHQAASFFSWENVKPLYIRASEAEEKLRQGLLKPV